MSSQFKKYYTEELLELYKENSTGKIVAAYPYGRFLYVYRPGLDFLEVLHKPYFEQEFTKVEFEIKG